MKLTKIKEKIVLSTFSVFSFVIEDVYQRIRIRSVLDKKIRTKREKKLDSLELFEEDNKIKKQS